MAATINNFISALNSPSSFMKSLDVIRAQRDTQGNVVIRRSANFAEASVLWYTKRYLLFLPLKAEALQMSKIAAMKISNGMFRACWSYRVLPDEMSYINSQGEVATADIVAMEIPVDVITLTDAIKVVHRNLLRQELQRLYYYFIRAKLSHLNLTPDNIYVDKHNTLYPAALHYAVDADEFDMRPTFDALLEFVSHGEESVESVEPFEIADLQHEKIACDELYGYRYVGNPFEGMCVAEEDQGFGYITPEGDELIPPTYLWAGDMREGRAEVETNSGMGLIDANGNYIIEPRYQIVEFDPATGHSRAKREEKWVTFDYMGRQL
ncbi:MAG: WG repeat-containing protein [Rikenellaceae bacterium]